MTSSQNGNNDNSNHDSDGNVVQFKPRAKKPEKQTVETHIHMNKSTEPLINLPTTTKYLSLLFIAVHIVIYYVLNQTQQDFVFLELGFIPNNFTETANFTAVNFFSPLTHMFIHGSVLHLAINTVMLVAFGSGVEKWVGPKNFLIIFLGSALIGLMCHLALHYNSADPVIGASGGISGLFAAALLMLNKTDAGVIGSPKYGLWPIIILWVGISVLFGLLGSPDGNAVAWEAHIGGFLGGFLIAKLLKL